MLGQCDQGRVEGEVKGQAVARSCQPWEKFCIYFRESSSTKMETNEERASDFSPCERNGAGGGEKKVLEAFKMRATFWVECFFLVPRFVLVFFFQLGWWERKRGALLFHLTPMSPSLLPGLPLFPSSTPQMRFLQRRQKDILGDGRVGKHPRKKWREE